MTKISLDPYLFFTGNCREAMEFYKKIFGGELIIQSLKDAGMGDSDNVMHAQLAGGEIDLLASDGDRKEPYEVSRISLSLSGNNETKLKSFFEQLAEGGKVESDLKTESWGDTFGMLTDKFGIDWMVNIDANKS